ncbi:MAG: hypothetical protein C4K60_05455 [Ideonella sp. MAG2]|nr:MAG: hypothetical protein C4K60_05455 [Ideonella sp. MAG2]
MSEAHADAPELTERIDPSASPASTATPASPASPAAHPAAEPPPAQASAVIQDEGFFAVHAPGASAGVSPQALIQAVVDWHNRHPLAAKIGPSDVGGLGFVQLPFEAPLTVRAEAPTGWRRWFSRGPQGPKPAFFDEQLIDGLAHQRIVRFAQQSGALQRTGEPNWPTRVLLTRAGAASPQPLYLLTAAFKTPKGATHRVLLAPGHLKQVLGRRAYSLPRIGMLLGGVSLAVALTLGGVWAYKALTAPAAHPPAKAKGKAAAASAASAAAAHGEDHAAHGEDHAAHGDGHAKHAAAAAAAEGASAAHEAHAAAASAPAPGADDHTAEHADGHKAKPQAGHTGEPQHQADAAPSKAAADTSHANPKADAAPGPAAAGTNHASATAAATATAAKEAKPDPVAGTVHALVTVPTWRRAEIEATQRELAKILGRHLNGMRAEILRLPEGEVLALMPLPNQAEAEALAARLANYGILMAPVNF